MYVPWVMLALCVSGALSRSTQRRDAMEDAHERTHLSALLDANSGGSESSSIHSKPKSKRSSVEFLLGQDSNRRPWSTSNTQRRVKRASPSTDEVTDGPASSWLRKSLPKTNFITAREHRTEKLKPSGDDENQRQLSVRTNEISTPTLRPRRPETAADRARDSAVLEPRQHAPTRRVIYYASLPEISSKPSENPTSQRRYEPLPLRPKYSRDSSRDESLARSRPVAVDRYRYNPSGRVNSYTIIDSEPPQTVDSRNYPSRAGNYQDLPSSKYNKIPAPYRPSDANRGPTQQPFYDSYPRNREPVVESGAPLIRDEPYRDYNPRQPAPWSVQIGTRLTVKDDGRPYRRDDGRPFRQEDDGQRRFYVNSQLNQDKSRYNAPDEDRTRYRLL